MKYINIITLIILGLGMFNTYKIEEKAIQEIQKQTINLNNKIESSSDINLTFPYLGYIEIEKISLKKVIRYGTDDNILNTNVVGLHKASVSLDEEFGNIILAGHNNKYVFKNLFKLKLNDEIKIISKISCYKYKIIKIDTIKKDDFSYFKYISDKKILTLITCVNDNERLIIVAELI